MFFSLPTVALTEDSNTGLQQVKIDDIRNMTNPSNTGIQQSYINNICTLEKRIKPPPVQITRVALTSIIMILLVMRGNRMCPSQTWIVCPWISAKRP
jgi:hypothetical protein